MSFSELIKNHNLKGFDLEIFGENHIFRGPIKDIEIKDSLAKIELSWCANRQINGKIWVLSSFNTFQFKVDQIFFELITKKIFNFSVWQPQDATIYAEKNYNLDYNLILK